MSRVDPHSGPRRHQGGPTARPDIAALVADARLDRRFEPRGPLINRYPDASGSAACCTLDGKPLPSVAPRERCGTCRTAGRAAAAARSPGATRCGTTRPSTALVAAVRGEAARPRLGPAAQQAVGRLFAPDYRRRCRRAGRPRRMLDDAVRTRNPLRARLRCTSRGRLRRSRNLLADRVNGDLAGVHGDRYRGAQPRARLYDDARALGQAARAPSAADGRRAGAACCAPRRAASGDTCRRYAAGAVRPGTLVLFELERSRAHAPGRRCGVHGGHLGAVPGGRVRAGAAAGRCGSARSRRRGRAGHEPERSGPECRRHLHAAASSAT